MSNVSDAPRDHVAGASEGDQTMPRRGVDKTTGEADGDEREEQDVDVPQADCRTLDRYMPDPSLRYVKVRFAGPGIARTLAPALLVSAGIAFVGAAVIGMLGDRVWALGWVAVVIGVGVVAVGAWWMKVVWLETWLRWCLWRYLGHVELGTDRAVPQPGTKLRYEVHFQARRGVQLAAVKVRFVFWERWRVRRRLRWLGWSYAGGAKQGHDLAQSVGGTIRLSKRGHAVVRGTLLVPASRPSEHKRGEMGHLSYVNLTTTVSIGGVCGLEDAQGSAPHLTTFPWQ